DWNNTSVLVTEDDSSRSSPDASHVTLQTGRSKEVRFIKKVPLNYPLMAQNMDVSGEVRVLVRIGDDGRLETATASKSSGSKLLDDAALSAANASTFTAGSIDGIPVEKMYYILYEFRLDGEPAVPTTSDLLQAYCPAIPDGFGEITPLFGG